MLCRKEREKAAWVEPGWTWFSFCFYNTHTSINECSGNETLYYENRPSAKQNTSINHSGGTFAALWQNPLLRSCFLSWTRLCPRSTREIVKDDLLPQVPLTSSKDLTALCSSAPPSFSKPKMELIVSIVAVDCKPLVPRPCVALARTMHFPRIMFWIEHYAAFYEMCIYSHSFTCA